MTDANLKGLICVIPDEEIITEPAKRWRNWWLTERPCCCVCSVCGAQRDIPGGESFHGHCRTYPSKDIAVTHAADLLTRDVCLWGAAGDEMTYLGAFPEGQRPPSNS